MLHILLFILKLCGILLLSILGIFLFVVICILFVPISYRLLIKKQSGTSLQLCTTWLLHMFRLDYGLQKKEGEEAWKNHFRLRFFGVPIQKKKIPKRKKKRSKKQITKNKKKKQNTQQTLSEAKPKIEPKTEKVQKEKPKKEHFEKKENFEKKALKKEISKEKMEKENKESRITGFWKNLKTIKDKKEQLFDFWNREEHRLVRKSVYKIFHSLWKKSRPKKIKGKVHFGFEDPSTTGLVLGFLSILQSQYKNEFILEADFEQEILEAEAELRGRISVFAFIHSFFRIYRDKNIRAMYHNWNELSD